MAQRAERSNTDVADSGVAAEELKQFIERAERLHEEREGIAGDLRDVFAEMRGRGFDVKVVKRIMARRRRDHSEVQEEDAIFDLYCQALGCS